MEELSVFIANTGFPIAISTYLLIRLEGKLVTLSESIDKLTNKLE